MKIKNTKEIKEYLNRIETNLNSNDQNDFLDGYVEPKDEKMAKKDLLIAGQLECKDPNLSLYVSVDDFNKNPYVLNVVNKILANKDLAYEEITFVKNVLFNLDSIIDDPNRECRDYMRLRMLDKDLNTIILKENGVEWMMAAPSESVTNDPCAKKAHGKVLTFGLGIGYFIYQAILNEKVDEITVIEKSKEVINIFKKIEKYFPKRIPINIIEGDAFDYFNQDYLSDYDYIYVDIYQNNKDGLPIIDKLLEQCLPPMDRCDFWIEASLTNTIRTLIYLIYKEIVIGKKASIGKDYQRYLNKVRNYFDGIDLFVEDANTLKDYMYSPKVIREILHKQA